MKRVQAIISAGVAATLLTCSFAGAAFAVDGVTENNPVVPITKDVTATHNVKDTFTFKVEPVKDLGNDAGNKVSGADLKPGVDLDKTSATVTFDGTKSTGDTSFDFTKVAEQGPGAYRYKVTEEAGTTPGVNYDTKEYIVDVIVSADNEVLYVVAKDGDKKAPIKFTNSVNESTLEVSKTVAGNQGDHTKDFSFTLTINANNCLPEGSTIAAKKTLADGGTEDVTLNVGVNNITLKHGEKIVASGLPVGVTYTVAEADYAADGYDKSVVGNENGEIDADGETVAYTNTKDTETPTGLDIEVLPYAAAGVAALGAGAMLVIRRRQSQEG